MTFTFTLRHAILAVVALIVALFLIAWLGIINIAASTGHWTITDRFLHWAMRNAVRTRSALTVEDPRLDFTGPVSAAGHYAVTCAVCHGAPGERPFTVMAASTPPAPDLRITASEWSDRQLLWIVKHGVKFTPMPAWPTQERNDEVRRMAAFVRRLPAMSTNEYRELAYGSGRIGGTTLRHLEDAIADCDRCHAEHGRGQPDIPVLAGQRAAYLVASLERFTAGTRASGVMGAAAARVHPALLQPLADHYESLPGLSDRPRSPPQGAATDDQALVWRIVEQGLPEANLPACARCHSPGKRADYPVLFGQKREFMAARLRRWRGEENRVEARKPNESMPMIARRIPERLIEPLAHYYAQGSPAAARAGDPAYLEATGGRLSCRLCK
jgi:cytochrome c553